VPLEAAADVPGDPSYCPQSASFGKLLCLIFISVLLWIVCILRLSAFGKLLRTL
jgi:hypothetical protein